MAAGLFEANNQESPRSQQLFRHAKPKPIRKTEVYSERLPTRGPSQQHWRPPVVGVGPAVSSEDASAQLGPFFKRRSLGG
jgi:hypothetical protein